MLREGIIDALQGDGSGPRGLALDLAAAAWGAGAAIHRAHALWRGPWLPPAPTISVGALTAGGAGKTPFTLEIVRRLRARGRRPAVLSRGYGGRGRGPHAVLPDEDPRLWGDEAVMMARALPGLLVVVDGDRSRGARLALARGADALILDDGLQHHPLGRHLDIALLPADRPPASDRLLPAGRLREPLSALSRAQLLVGYGGAPEGDGSPGVDVVASFEIRRLKSLWHKEDLPMTAIAGAPVGLWTAVARPQRVRRAVEALGAEVVWHEAEADHAPLPAGGIDGLLARCRAAGASLLLLTEKDAVKLGPPPSMGPPVHVLTGGIAFERGEDRLEAALDQALTGEIVPLRMERGR